MDFLVWWFNDHWFWSTTLTPGSTCLWLIFNDTFTFRFWFSGLLFLLVSVLSSSGYDHNHKS
jgi:hypothetical protein